MDRGTGSILLTRVSASIMHGNSLETLLTVLQPSRLLPFDPTAFPRIPLILL
jgi:hypothetical protein